MLLCSLIPPEAGKAADINSVDLWSPGSGSSGKSRLKAPAQFGAKKDIHIPQWEQVKQNKNALPLCGAKAIIDFHDISSTPESAETESNTAYTDYSITIRPIYN
jgi:hypothetical protein